MTEPTIAEVRSLTDRYTRTVLAEPTGWERDLQASEDRAAPLTPAEIDADPVAAALLPPTIDEPRAYLERIGPSYKVVIRPLAARFLFRDVRTDRDLAADVTVSLEARHLFRTTVTLSLTGRDKIAKTAAELARGDPNAWRRATFAAVEAVLEAEERLGAPVDLRSAPIALPAGGLDVARHFWPVGTMQTVAPGDAGKSTIMRAVAVSLAGGLVVIPGIEPIGDPRPILYVAGEDPIAYWHSRSIEAICRGLGIDRSRLAQPIELYDARGRPLHRIARAIAERAADFGAVILDSQQALLAQADASGGIRDRDGLFWNGVDQMDRPTAIVGHPNRDDAKRWAQADGRIAGSEVNRDRVRMAWRGTFRDEPAVAGTSYRRYTLDERQEQPRAESRRDRVRRLVAIRDERIRSRRAPVHGRRAAGRERPGRRALAGLGRDTRRLPQRGDNDRGAHGRGAVDRLTRRCKAAAEAGSRLPRGARRGGRVTGVTTRDCYGVTMPPPERDGVTHTRRVSRHVTGAGNGSQSRKSTGTDR